ncbi:GNAT family N-acetyltransferase [Chitinivorax sp. B]|uniref:GNAT family N-acetyltransferase n=1 Tax=Chitinivorax sp. B TaxID=2502235 RepID=UPI002016EFBE|nr:GNAT family N-acetyltransferase [Chitinivorax sp. B]
MMQISWQCLAFSELDTTKLYAMMVLRQRVFIVEQDCVYLDADGADLQAHHLLAWSADGILLAYARLLPPGVKFADASFGRVVTAPEARGKGIGRLLLAQIMQVMDTLFPHQPITIGAQTYLKAFYGRVGFTAIGPEYLEDGLPHIDMRRLPALPA